MVPVRFWVVPGGSGRFRQVPGGLRVLHTPEISSLFDYKVVNSALDNLLVSGSEMFIYFSIKRGVRKVLQSFFLVEVGPPNSQSVTFVGRFDN